MRFIIDAQLPPALARLLTALGHQAEHVADIGLRDAGDSLIWNYALKWDAILVTKDEDFPWRLQQSTEGPVVLWLRHGNASRRALLAWFVPMLPRIEELFNQGERLIEVR